MNFPVFSGFTASFQIKITSLDDLKINPDDFLTEFCQERINFRNYF
jgi:hypothetical protein